MGSVKKKTITRKLPKDAKVLTRRNQQYAEWIGRNGRKRTAPVKKGPSGDLRIQEHTQVYYAKYRDGQGDLCEVSTGCRDKQAAMTVLHNLENQVEKVKSGIISPEDRIAKHQATPLAEHIQACQIRLEAHETSQGHRDNVRRSLDRIIDYCRFATLPDFNRKRLSDILPTAEPRMRQPVHGIRTERRWWRSAIGASKRAGLFQLHSRESERPTKTRTAAWNDGRWPWMRLIDSWRRLANGPCVKH